MIVVLARSLSAADSKLITVLYLVGACTGRSALVLRFALAVLPCLAVTSQASSAHPHDIARLRERLASTGAALCTTFCRRGINARIRGSRNHSPPHAVTPSMRLTIISGVSVPATRRWLVIAPPRNPVRMIAPSTLVVGITYSTRQMSASAPISHVWSSG